MSPVLLPYMYLLTFIASHPVSTESEKFRRVLSNSWHFQISNLRSLSYQRSFRRKLLREKDGFPGMITFVHCMSHKVTVKTKKRIISIWERREQAGHMVWEVFCTVHWFLPSERPCPWALPHRNLLDKHSYADPKLTMSHNYQYISFFDIWPKDLIAYSTDTCSTILIVTPFTKV